MNIPYDGIESLTEAYKALDEASARGDRMACRYLVGVVIARYKDLPKLSEEETEYLRSRLAGDIEEPSTLEDFLSLHEGSVVTAISDVSREEAGENYVFPTVVKGKITDEVIVRAKWKRVGLFFTPNPVSGDTHNDSDVSQFRYFFLDFDGGDKEKPFAWLEKMNLIPTFIVDTRNGFHAYFRLHSNTLSPEVWKDIQSLIVESSGADPKVKNPARLLRLPWSYHGKESPYLCQIVSWTGRVYEWEHFREKFPERKKEVYTMSRPTYPTRTEAPEPTPVVAGKGERHGTLLEQAGIVYAKIREQEELSRQARENIVYWYGRSHSPQKPDWEFEANNVCDHIERRQFGRVVSR